MDKKKDVFDLDDINEELCRKIVFYYVLFASSKQKGRLIAITEDGCSFTIDQKGTDMEMYEIFSYFPEIAEFFTQSRRERAESENKYYRYKNWFCQYCGKRYTFFVREEYISTFSKWTTKWFVRSQMEDLCRYFPGEILYFAREFFDVRKCLVYVKNRLEEEIEEKRRQESGITDRDVKWVEYCKSGLLEYTKARDGCFLLLFKGNRDGSIDRYKYTIQYQREQTGGRISYDVPIECYILSVKNYPRLQKMPEYPVKTKAERNEEDVWQENALSYYKVLTDDRQPCWCNDIGEFIRSYKTLKEAKAGALANSRIDKANLIPIDYDMLQKQM